MTVPLYQMLYFVSYDDDVVYNKERAVFACILHIKYGVTRQKSTEAFGRGMV